MMAKKHDLSHLSHTQQALMAPVVAYNILFHPGPKAEALKEFRRELWLILQGQKEGYRQLRIQHSSSVGYGTGMAADVDQIIEAALRMPMSAMPEKGGIRIGYRLQLSGPEAASPEQRAKMAEGVDDG